MAVTLEDAIDKDPAVTGWVNPKAAVKKAVKDPAFVEIKSLDELLAKVAADRAAADAAAAAKK
jgi:hypothetical protein